MIASRYFSRSEFACRCGCGYDTIDADLVAILHEIREHFGSPIIITSGTRCKLHNDSLPNAAKKSAHLIGRAVDFYVLGVDDGEVVEWLEEHAPHCGIGRYDGRTHVDTKEPLYRRWDYRK